MMNMEIAVALGSLCPNAEWSLMGDDLTGLTWLDTVQKRPTDAEIAAEVARLAALPPMQAVLSQDLMAQFTAADAAKIRAAVNGRDDFWLLWSAMQAQKDPMTVGNARFMTGWGALVQVLGADRMTAIATALNVTVG